MLRNKLHLSHTNININCYWTDLHSLCATVFNLKAALKQIYVLQVADLCMDICDFCRLLLPVTLYS